MTHNLFLSSLTLCYTHGLTDHLLLNWKLKK